MDKTFQIAHESLTMMQRHKLAFTLQSQLGISDMFTEQDVKSLRELYQSTASTLLTFQPGDFAVVRFAQQEAELGTALDLMIRISAPDSWAKRRCVMLRNAIVHWPKAREVIDAYKCSYTTPILGTYIAKTSHLKGHEYEDFLFLYKEAVGLGRFNEVTAAATPVFDHCMF